ncbi:Autophagy-related protein 9A [Myotis davidii]|uniref:Autophagy-related protein 9 n=1 Tax=Myotis davidii TaxID=225400 RepID=L5MDJ3_MYODS|nr:Autophagy-related protein 9A [Myotis davidii]
MVFCPEQLLRVILAHIHYMPDNWRGNIHHSQTRNEFAQLFQYKAVFILEELLSSIITPLTLIFCLHPRALEIIDFCNFTVEVVNVGDTYSFVQMDVCQHGHPQWLSTGQTEASVYQQTEGGQELSRMHFAITNLAGSHHVQYHARTASSWSSVWEGQLQSLVLSEYTSTEMSLHALYMHQLHKQQTQAEPERNMWHRQESDDSGASAPEEGGEGSRHPQLISLSATYPCAAASRPGAAETAALQGGF